MTGWQDSFQPVQQGWQDSFQPDQPPAPSIVEDVGKSAGSGAASIAMNALNTLGFIKNAGNYVLGNALTGAGGLYEAAGGEVPLSTAQWMRNPISGGSDATSVMQNQILPAVVQAKTGMNMNYQPQTGLGQAVKTGLESLPMIAGGESSIPNTMLRAAGIGLGSETGGQIAQAAGAGENGQQAGQLLGGIGGAMLPEVRPAPPMNIPDTIKQNLFNGSPDVRTYAGEELGQKLSGAEQNAYINKNLAYDAAAEPSNQVTLAPNHVNNLANSIEESTQGFNPDVVKNVGGVQKIIDSLREDMGSNSDVNMVTQMSKGQNPLTWARIDNARQQIYNLPKVSDSDAAVRANALSAYHNFTNDLLQKGIVDGDPSALNLIKEANSQNAAYRQGFKGKDANNAISNFIQKQGGIDSVSPEALLDTFTKVGQAGFDNVRAAQQVLGDEATPLLKQGYLDKLRAASVDQNGEFVPAKLQKNINTLITKNPNLVKSVFTPEELQGLQGISNVASRYTKGPSKGMIGSVITKIPIAREIFGGAIENNAKTKMMNNIKNPRVK